MKSLAGGVLGIAAALAVQVAISRWFPMVSDRIDLLLMVVVYYGAVGAQVSAMLAGAAAGLLQDVWFGGLLGRNGFRKVLTGYLVGAVGARFALETPITHAIALALATLLDHLTGVLLGLIMGLPLADPFSHVVWERAAVNALLGSAGYALIGRMTVREGGGMDRSRQTLRGAR